MWKSCYKNISNGGEYGYKYSYYVRVNGPFIRINDPYAIASSANEKYNYVVDGSNRQGTYTIIPSIKGRGSNTIIKLKTELNFGAGIRCLLSLSPFPSAIKLTLG